MSFLIVLALYLLPNVYVYLRIRKLLATRRSRVLLTVLFLMLVFAFPAMEMFAHASSLHIGRGILLFGFMSLPFLLYLFLLVLAFDLLRGLNRLLNVVPLETLNSSSARIITLCLLCAIPSLIVIAGHAHFSDLRINEYHVQLPRRASSIRHLKIALASDFHLNELTDEELLRRFVEKVNLLNADLLLLAGDVLEGDRLDGQLEEFERQFRLIGTRYGVYASLGNHESYGRKGKLEFFRQSLISVLEDTVVVVDSAFSLIGRSDGRAGQRKPIDALMRLAPHGLPTIVLDHRPTDIGAITATHADVLVSGHTHEGQLFPFNYITERIYQLSWGYRKIQNTHVFVTSGIQVWGPPVRTAGDSEIMVINADLTE